MYSEERIQNTEECDKEKAEKEVLAGAGEASGKKEKQRAAASAMNLLLYRQRTEKELRCRLSEKGYSEEAVEEAVRYTSSFGYLNDKAYAEVYLHSMESKKSRFLIRRELLNKGVPEEYIEETFEASEDREEEVLFELLKRKLGVPHIPDEKEKRRAAAYCERRGFSISQILKQLDRYQELQENEE
ncbi:MAG: regulatory protein RecX [Eubacterium sp.]|nr:regulatory protein RecX [Eubacterium sp.]